MAALESHSNDPIHQIGILINTLIDPNANNSQIEQLAIVTHIRKILSVENSPIEVGDLMGNT